MNKEFMGNVVTELQEIDKLNQPNKDSIEIYQITEGSGGFLTWICC